jgi:hypothetical protein
VSPDRSDGWDRALGRARRWPNVFRATLAVYWAFAAMALFVVITNVASRSWVWVAFAVASFTFFVVPGLFRTAVLLNGKPEPKKWLDVYRRRPGSGSGDLGQ